MQTTPTPIRTPNPPSVQTLIAQAMRDCPSPLGAESRAAAWLETLTPLDSHENCRAYIGRVAYAAKHRLIRPTAITQHIYLVQTAILALRSGK